MLIAQVANYYGLGNRTTVNADGSWLLNVIACKLGRYSVKIIQNKHGMMQNRQLGQFIHTTSIEVEGAKGNIEGENVVMDICALLSLASMSQVVAFEFATDSGGWRRISVRGVSMMFRPLLDTNNGDSVVSFLQQIWPRYRKLKRPRKLYAVIDMLTFTDAPSRPLELKLAQIFIILENLKGTYAHVHHIPFFKGFRKISSPPKASLKKEPTIPFETLLKDMLHEVGMKRGIKRLIELRNEIIHFGLSRKPFRVLTGYYNNGQDIVREYLLRLLGYEGNFLIYSRASRFHKHLGRR